MVKADTKNRKKLVTVMMSQFRLSQQFLFHGVLETLDRVNIDDVRGKRIPLSNNTIYKKVLS